MQQVLENARAFFLCCFAGGGWVVVVRRRRRPGAAGTHGAVGWPGQRTVRLRYGREIGSKILAFFLGLLVRTFL